MVCVGAGYIPRGRPCLENCGTVRGSLPPSAQTRCGRRLRRIQDYHAQQKVHYIHIYQLLILLES